jgi:hypothetical protein
MVRSFDAQRSVLAFPLGGIGTGNISLGARGDLRDWEIFNHPGKGTRLPNTFFAIRAQAGAAPAVTRVLEGPIPPPHALSHGYHPWTAAGLPRLAGATFHGAYPLAAIDFADDTLPLVVHLEAFTQQDDDNAFGTAITVEYGRLQLRQVRLQPTERIRTATAAVNSEQQARGGAAGAVPGRRGDRVRGRAGVRSG